MGDAGSVLLPGYPRDPDCPPQLISDATEEGVCVGVDAGKVQAKAGAVIAESPRTELEGKGTEGQHGGVRLDVRRRHGR